MLMHHNLTRVYPIASLILVAYSNANSAPNRLLNICLPRLSN